MSAAAHAPASLAQGYRTKPIRLVIPYPPGGGNDTLGRIVAQRLSTALGDQTVPELVAIRRTPKSNMLGFEQGVCQRRLAVEELFPQQVLGAYKV